MTKGLEALYSGIEVNTKDYGKCTAYTPDCIDIIEKELKALDMLKKKMTIETDYYDSDFGCEKYEYIAYNGTALNIDTQEEFGKVTHI